MKVITNPRFATPSTDTFVRSFTKSSDFTTTTSPKTVTVSWEAGDVIVAAWAVASGNVSPTAPTATGLTFTQRQYLNNSSGETEVAIYTAKAASAGSSVSVSSTYTGGSDGWGLCVWVIGSANDYVDGFINLNESATSHTVPAGATVCYLCADWAAAATGDGTLAMTTGSGTATERHDDGTTSTMNLLIGEWAATGAGSFSFGLSNYSPGGGALAVCQAAVVIGKAA